MSVPPCRPSERERIYSMIAGEVVCRDCDLPVGHPECRLFDQEVWNLLAAKVDYPETIPEACVKWGIAYPLDPPRDPAFHGERWVKSKGEDVNYHYTAPNGWELHIRENDDSGYCYTLHYEISPEHSPAGHLMDIAHTHNQGIREQTDRQLGRSGYEAPWDLLV